MTIDNIIEGLTILKKYCGAFPVAAEHDAIYVNPKIDIGPNDIIRLRRIGWVQENTNNVDEDVTSDEVLLEQYDPTCGWMAFT